MNTTEVEFDIEMPDPSWDYYPVWDLVKRAKESLNKIEEEIEKYDSSNPTCDAKINELVQDAIEKLSYILP
jgi:hypothetical protein